MPYFEATGSYVVESVHEHDGSQMAVLKKKNGNNRITVRGIPNDIDLSGDNVYALTYNIDDDNPNRNKNKPDKLEIFRRDKNGEIMEEGQVELYKNSDGTYRHRTEDEVRETDKRNGLPPLSKTRVESR